MFSRPTAQTAHHMIEGAPIDMDARDPRHMDAWLPLWWLLASVYFRAEVRGMEKIPRDRPVLFVGNHSGGNMSPDSSVFVLAHHAYFGGERALYVLAHALVTSFPVLGPYLRRWGVITAGPEAARAALSRGANVLVYPGGDVETHRPFWLRHRICFDDRKGFIRLAREASVPIVPVVAEGGHSTYLPLTDGRRLAQLLGLDRIARLKVLPVALALPFGLTVGDFGHIPLPAKIRIEILEPIDVAARFGADDAAAYDYITTRMQEALYWLSSEKVLPPRVRGDGP
jgi:1-acyl-sn-glycerol-3-phosphate acyltransferase